MYWHIQGNSYACCSCGVGCSCAYGGNEAKGSDGCCAVQIMEIDNGNIGGLDVGGTSIAAVVDWPGPMMAGNGIGRLYFDPGTTEPQRDALRDLIGGKFGGVFSRMPELIPKVLPPIIAPISKQDGRDGTWITVGHFGEARVNPMSSPEGESPRLRGSGGFRDEVALATGTGSWWRDPDLREWQGGGYAEQNTSDWHR